jgi:Rieske Fe-S protein
VLSRRVIVAGAGAVASVGLLSACGSTTTAPAAPAAPVEPPVAPGPAAASAANALASTDDIPVGGGRVFADQDVVVTQPTAGEFKAYSATCTHQGCKVAEVEAGVIACPCHGGRFAIADGAVVGGPPKRPLPEKEISVEGTSIVLA